MDGRTYKRTDRHMDIQCETIKWRVKSNFKTWKKKMIKINLRIYSNHMHIFTLPTQFQKDWHKTAAGVADTQGIHYVYTLIVSKPEKMTYFKTQKKVIKIKLKNISKSHAHLQTMTKTSVQFQKDWHKTVQGVTDARYILCGTTHHWKPNTMSPPFPRKRRGAIILRLLPVEWPLE